MGRTKGLTNERRFTEIVKWLYVNDGKFKSGAEWKAHLIEFIGKTLGLI
jgi:hypothetical protein